MRFRSPSLFCAALFLAVSGWAEQPLVVVARLDSEIHPAAAQYVGRVVAEADRAKASLVVLEISTPGGLMASMREITTSIVNSKVPVAVFVAPAGSNAASAGFFILLSGDVAAMSPGTNAGAAHPVGSGGEDIPKTLNTKIEQDALAQIRTLARAHGRNIEAAEAAVSQSVSYTESEAKEKGLIDVIARDTRDLVRQLDGRKISRTAGGTLVLHLAGARYQDVNTGAVEKALGVVSEPNVAYVLFLIGLVGLYFELSHPGAVLPGVAGAVSLILALYAFSVLPVNTAGLGLVALGVLFFIGEVKFPTHGMLALAGGAAVVSGSMVLFSGSKTGYRVDVAMILPGALLAAGVMAALSIRAAAVRRRPVVTGPEGLIGSDGKALSDVGTKGSILVHGEYWDARSERSISAGSAVRVIAREGMTLVVADAGERKEGTP